MLALMSPFFYLGEGACTMRIALRSESAHALSLRAEEGEGACTMRIALRSESVHALSPRKLISEGSRLCARMHLVLKDIFDMTDILC